VSTSSAAEVCIFLSYYPSFLWGEKIILLRSLVFLYLLALRFDPQSGLLTGTNDGTLVNFFLRIFGRKTEKSLCTYLLVFQVIFFFFFVFFLFFVFCFVFLLFKGILNKKRKKN